MATLIGKFPDGQYGLRVGVPGYNILSNPVDDAQLYFSSEWPTTMYVHHQQLVNVPASSFTAADILYFDYTNGPLPYTPYVMVDVKYPASALGASTVPAGSIPIWGDAIGSDYFDTSFLQVAAYKTRFAIVSRRSRTVGITVFARAVYP
jgi:hypothetical protein